MGYYIQGPTHGKAAMLCAQHQASRITEQDVYETVEAGYEVVCVVDNMEFEAAGFCYCVEEAGRFMRPDSRPKTWLRMPRDEAERLSGYSS